MNIAELLNSPKLKELKEALGKGASVLVEELWNSPKALIAALAQEATGKHVLILTGASQEEARLFHDFAFFTDAPIIDFPAWETLPSENVPPSPDIVGDRYQVLRQIEGDKRPKIILSSLQACLQKLLPPNRFQKLYFHLHKGETVPFEGLQERLKEMGYQKRAVAADKGEFAVRGGIIDLFPVSSPDPYRLEFWGDEIESIRIYDPIGQKSIRQVEEVSIPPAQELELIREQTQLSTLLDYLGPNTLVFFDDLLALEDRYSTLTSMTGGFSHIFMPIEQFLDQLAPLQKIFSAQESIENLSEVRLKEKLSQSYYSASLPMHRVAFQMFNRDLEALRWQNPFVSLSDYLLPEMEEVTGEEILQALHKLPYKETKLHVIASTELEEGNFEKRIKDAGVHLPQKTTYQRGYLSTGLVLPEEKLLLLPLTEITHRYKIRRQKQRSTYHTLPTEVYALNPGEMVVHYNHGIGKYLGLDKRPNNMGILSEFLTLEYAEGAKLYVPINQSHLVSKYIGSTEETPKMHTLGSTRWKKAKEQTERAILAYAADLLQLYAQREMKGGFAYPPDSEEMGEFEEDFPFVETEDQLNAIAEIKQEMVSQKAMDRLICGDVGYGKTEVAMRAAFKAAVDGGKQVAVLVPTTVLAMQHFENFLERMANFPVNIGVLSRFRTAKQIRETLEGVENGSVDILIGTHRIISEDVKFKDLGLIIIDEEQRFGVKAKEHLKKVKVGVDCLTLSATPIPRTLYMSLVGARDMSVINTPPQDRLPITTTIAELSDQLLKSVILRELARDGQVYIIHNRVESIFEVGERIKKVVPQARIVIGHGQMHSDEIDTVFHAFKNHHADILIATTIVANGIDIPNANTILIDRADTFGLADLYQLRGRVGRWNRRAYAYFLVPRMRSLPELSRKRLNALVESSGYGGGMKIAMHDLQIRGAGNILGHEQSGHVSSIGFTLYCKLLKRTILALQGKAPSILIDTKIELPVDARLPEEYVNELDLRMEIYQRLAEALSLEEVDVIWHEVADRFGPPPLPAEWLYRITRVRVVLSQQGYTSVKLEKMSLVAEKQSAKETSSRKVLFSLPKTPKEFEQRILKLFP